MEGSGSCRSTNGIWRFGRSGWHGKGKCSTSWGLFHVPNLTPSKRPCGAVLPGTPSGYFH
jgi:hypothetical protein